MRGMDRRAFLRSAGASAGLVLLAPAGLALAQAAPGGGLRPAAADGEAGVDASLARALASSGFVYVSPLRSDGRESRCHGEVWYGWLDGGVVIITGRDGWKGRAVARGLDRARVWVGDHGRWKQWLGTNEDFRTAPSFEARAEIVRDEALLDRLLALYERKYPEEIGSWRDRMRSGFRDGSRVLIRYVPEPSSAVAPGGRAGAGSGASARRART